MLVPPTGGSVRSYEIRRWQVRLVASVSVLLLVGSLVGGTVLGGTWRDEEIADIDALLWDTQLSVAALSDTLQAMRVAATMASGSPSAGARPTNTAVAMRLSTRVRRGPAPGVVLPVFGRLSSGFSRSRLHPILRIRRPHLGLDIVAPSGTHIRAPAAGRVSRVEREFGFGLVVEIDHGQGVVSRYAHCKSALVNVGDQVEAGAEIATVGSSGLATGPHLHLEVLVNHRQVDPLGYVITGPAAPAAGGAQGVAAGAGSPGSAGSSGGAPAAPAPTGTGTALGHTTNPP
jgi:murein DD-endopeptidase MepM/ murein hydrolase activator NlpD